MTGLVLVVDDRREVRELLAEEFGEAGLRVVQAADGVQGWACYRRAEPDLVVTDLRMPRSDGIDLLRRIREVSCTPVILLTAYDDVANSVVALSSGAEEFMTFPDDLGRLVERARLLARAAPELAPADLLAGSSSRIRRVREQISRLAGHSSPVLVRGESVRGRASVVGELHGRGPSAAEALVHVDAGAGEALPPAGAACLHLCGVERLSPEAQRRWREFLEAPAAGRPRLLASTAADLSALSQAGGFDAGLAAHLLRDVIELPTLRDRPDDLRELVPALVRRLARLSGRHDVKVPPPVVTALRSFSWPGDLDQLVEVLEIALRRASQGLIRLENVDAALAELEPGAESLRAARDRRQREELGNLFEECQGNLAEMARRLGVSRGSVVYRLKTLGLPQRSGEA